MTATSTDGHQHRVDQNPPVGLIRIAGLSWVTAVLCALAAMPVAWADHLAQHAAQPGVKASVKANVKASPASTREAVQVSGAWVRAAVKGQSGTGGFMRLLSPAGATLVGFATPVAESAELHEMAMEGDVMRMRPIDSVRLPANQAVELKPGGHHLMLMGLKKPLKVGESLRLTLRFKGADGQPFEQVVKVPVQSTAPAGPPGAH